MTSPIAVAITPHRSATRRTVVELVRLDDQQHALLRLAGQHLVRLHRRLAQRHQVEVDRPCRCRPAALVSVRAQVRPAPPRSWTPTMSCRSYSSRQLSMSSFSMNGSPTCTTGRRWSALVVEGGAGQHGDAADAVAAGLRPEQHDRRCRGRGLLALQPVDRQDANAQRVDQRVALVGRVEDDLAADVGQAEAVAVAADAGHHAGQDALRCPRGRPRRSAAGPSPRSGGRPWRGCRGRCRRRRWPRPGSGSTKLGWLCDSTLKVTARSSEIRTTPAFSPMPASSRSDGGAFSPNCRRWTLLLLYEQCSLHMIEYMASSDLVGRRPRICLIRSYSSSRSPNST